MANGTESLLEDIYDPGGEIAKLQGQYMSQNPDIPTATGDVSDFRHEGVMSNISDYFNPFGNMRGPLGTAGNIFGDVSAYGAGLINEFPALFDPSQTWGAIGEDLAANYRGTFGTPYGTSTSDIYKNIFGVLPSQYGTDLDAAQAAAIENINQMMAVNQAGIPTVAPSDMPMPGMFGIQPESMGPGGFSGGAGAGAGPGGLSGIEIDPFNQPWAEELDKKPMEDIGVITGEPLERQYRRVHWAGPGEVPEGYQSESYYVDPSESWNYTPGREVFHSVLGGGQSPYRHFMNMLPTGITEGEYREREGIGALDPLVSGNWVSTPMTYSDIPESWDYYGSGGMGQRSLPDYLRTRLHPSGTHYGRYVE